MRSYDGPDTPEIVLPRGDVTEGVVRVGDTVRRPRQAGSDAVAAYLDHLAAVGFDRAPRHRGIDRQGRDVLDHLDGDVAGAVLPAWVATDRAARSVGRLTRAVHEASRGWRPEASVRFPRDLTDAPPTPLPPGVPLLVAHNDMTPQNVVFRDGSAWGVIDFDLAGWTTHLTDLVTTAMWWAPLCDPCDRDPVFGGTDVGRRLRLVVDGYGLDLADRSAFLEAAALRFGGLTASMRWRAEHLGGGWERMWREGIGETIARRVSWFARVRDDLAVHLGV